MGRGSSKAAGNRGHGAGGRSDRVAPGLQKHFDTENKRVAEFLASKADYVSIEMDNGQILEKTTIARAKSLLNDFKHGDMLNDGESLWLLYKDGSDADWRDYDDLRKIRLTGLKGMIYNNVGTTMIAGKGIKIENYNQIYAFEKYTRYGTSKWEDDWRADFE